MIWVVQGTQKSTKRISGSKEDTPTTFGRLQFLKYSLFFYGQQVVELGDQFYVSIYYLHFVKTVHKKVRILIFCT